MSLSAARLAMMDVFGDITGITVPPDPLPREIDDKTIVVFPRSANMGISSRGKAGSIVVRSNDVMQVEYHRRVPYEHLGSTMGDVTAMIETIELAVWGQFASGGGGFDGTVFSIESVSLIHFGALGWNEWTFGARLEIAFTHLDDVSS